MYQTLYSNSVHSALYPGQNFRHFLTLTQTISRPSYGSFVTHLNCCYSPAAPCSTEGPIERQQLTLHNSTTHTGALNSSNTDMQEKRSLCKEEQMEQLCKEVACAMVRVDNDWSCREKDSDRGKEFNSLSHVLAL